MCAMRLSTDRGMCGAATDEMLPESAAPLLFTNCFIFVMHNGKYYFFADGRSFVPILSYARGSIVLEKVLCSKY